MHFFLKRFYFLFILLIYTGQQHALLANDFDVSHVNEILEHKQVIASIKQRWKPKVELLKQQDPVAYSDFERMLQTGHLTKMADVNSGVYILEDEDGQAKYIIKPLDERIFCVNNQKTIEEQYSLTYLMRSHIPNYEAVQREAFTYYMASLIGVEYLVPKTLIAIVQREEFFDIFDQLPPDQHSKWASHIDKEKLCSVQVFIPNAQLLYDREHEWIDKDYSENNILKQIAPVSFENLMILIWSIYDTDVHGGNILFQLSSRLHDPIYKIDHDLSFPEANGELMNCLASLPQVNFFLSSRAQEKIKKIPLEAIRSWMHFFELEKAIEAFIERIELLQTLAAGKFTILEIDLRLRLLGLPNGKELALKNWTIDELFDYLETTLGSYTYTSEST